MHLPLDKLAVLEAIPLRRNQPWCVYRLIEVRRALQPVNASRSPWARLVDMAFNLVEKRFFCNDMIPARPNNLRNVLPWAG